MKINTVEKIEELICLHNANFFMYVTYVYAYVCMYVAYIYMYVFIYLFIIHSFYRI